MEQFQRYHILKIETGEDEERKKIRQKFSKAKKSFLNMVKKQKFKDSRSSATIENFRASKMNAVNYIWYMYTHMHK